MENTTMKSTFKNMTSSKLVVNAGAIILTACVASVLIASPEKKETSTKKENAASTPSGPAEGQKQFDTPKQAADALIQVASNFDANAAKEILGPDSEDLVSSGDPVADKNQA